METTEIKIVVGRLTFQLDGKNFVALWAEKFGASSMTVWRNAKPVGHIQAQAADGSSAAFHSPELFGADGVRRSLTPKDFREGDELVVVLPGRPEESASTFAQRMQEMVSAYRGQT